MAVGSQRSKRGDRSKSQTYQQKLSSTRCGPYHGWSQNYGPIALSIVIITAASAPEGNFSIGVRDGCFGVISGPSAPRRAMSVSRQNRPSTSISARMTDDRPRPIIRYDVRFERPPQEELGSPSGATSMRQRDLWATAQTSWHPRWRLLPHSGCPSAYHPEASQP